MSKEHAAGKCRLGTGAAFAAYALCSWGFAQGAPWWGDLYYAQAAVYLVAAIALFRSLPWATWFAVGIGLSGLVVDVAYSAVLHVDGYLTADTLGQGLLFWLALRNHRSAARAASPYRSTAAITPSSDPRIGWTFALAAGTLPPSIMAAFAPLPAGYLDHAPVGIAPHGHAWLFALPILAVGALVLLGRGKVLGLVAAAGTAAIGVLVFGDSFADPLHVMGTWDLRVEHLFALLGHGFLFASLLPLAPAALRRLSPPTTLPR